MDLLRSCYVGQMEFWGGVGGTVPVRWYFVEDNAPVFDFPHLYGSRNWDPQGPAMVGLGEPQNTSQTYNKGAPPQDTHPADQPACGPDDWYQNGVPVDTPPLELNAHNLPICCFGNQCQPFYDGTLCQNAELHDSWTGLTWVLFFQDESDVEWFDSHNNYFVDIESNEPTMCGTWPATMVPPGSWTLPGIPTADSCQFVSYDAATFTGTYQFYAGSSPLAGKFLFFKLPTCP